MELNTIYGNVIFALDTAKTVAELVSAALAAKKSLSSADLRSADLSSADLRSADLRSADLSSANLSSADLRSAKLSYADLRSANLRSADLRSANLGSADLGSADLSYANLSYANLRSADLSSADLSSANLSSADLRSAKLRYAKNAELALAQIQFIPTEGSFIGWKKCKGEAMVKLGISSRAKRSHGAGRKCRCSRAKVHAIWDAEGKPITEATSYYDSTFVYRVGEIIEPKNGWDENRWNVCKAGIHFFITREEAQNFKF